MLGLVFSLINFMFTLILMFVKLLVRFGLLLANALIAAIRGSSRSSGRRR